MAGSRVRRRERGALHAIGVGLSAGLLALLVCVGLAAIVVPNLAGATPFTVLTRSMEPTYPPGTLVVVQPVSAHDIRIGDAVTYQIESGRPDLVTHRVIAISKTTAGGITFTTMGDNNDVADANPVLPAQIRGRVWYSIPWIGNVTTLVGGGNRSWIVGAVVIILFVYAGWMFVSGARDRARRRRRDEARRDERDNAPRVDTAET